MSKKFSELNQFRVGLVGVVATALLVALALNVGALRELFTSTQYTAEFSHSGGLRSGDSVRVSGLTVGKVGKVELKGRHVEVTFALSGVDLGDETRAAVHSDNALGAKFLAIDPGGSGEVSTIPRSHTEDPYDIVQALGDLSATTAELDVDQLATSFTALSETFADSAPELKAALSGVTALSQTISERDAELANLLEHANSVTGVLADRSQQITQIMSNASALFAELDARQAVIEELLVNAQLAADQLSGLVDDNAAQIKPVLDDLEVVIESLNLNRENIASVLTGLGPYARSLGEAVGGGPWFYAYIQNLIAPTDLAPILPDLIRTEEP